MLDNYDEHNMAAHQTMFCSYVKCVYILQQSSSCLLFTTVNLFM